jgi:hypothetical protein
MRKMPGLGGAYAKRGLQQPFRLIHLSPPHMLLDINPTNAGVRLGAVTSILEDALDGIEAGTVDMALMKHYVTSALCILKTLT